MGASNESVANIIGVDVDSPAYDAGFEPGCAITDVDGHPVRDMIDWRWLSSDESIDVGYIDTDGDRGRVVLERALGQDWGLQFDGAVFDGVRTCRNACTFCFMRQLPKGMRSSLSVRDDDYRLSFLEGTFSTFTNMGDDDISRIIEQHISPLRVSLHAIDGDVRRRMIGKHERAGIDAVLRLMDAGIDLDAQIVLVPGENDGDVLDETISWCYSNPHIRNLGIVPLGYTSHQSVFHESFDEPGSAMRVLEQIEPYQDRAIEERGFPWVYAADEFYCNAYGDDVLDHIPSTGFYGDFSMFEDGIGIVRSAVDAWEDAEREGLLSDLEAALSTKGARVLFICGESMKGYANKLVPKTLSKRFAFHFAKNGFFGGNVDVTGLLCGCDIASALKRIASAKEGPFVPENSQEPQGHSSEVRICVIPDVVFNDDAVTLDGWTLDDIEKAIDEEYEGRLLVSSSNPLDYIKQITDFARSME